MNDKRKLGNIQRRSILKWTPPLVTAVLLPAHAQATPMPTTVPPTTVPPTTVPPTTAPPMCDITPEVSFVGFKDIGTYVGEYEIVGNIDIISVVPSSDRVTVNGSSLLWDTGIVPSDNPSDDAGDLAEITTPTVVVTYTCNGDPMEQVATLTLPSVVIN